MVLSHLPLRFSKCTKPYHCYYSLFLLHRGSGCFSSLCTTAPESSTSKPTSLSARMSFIFEQIDQIDKQREEKDQTLQRIRAWRESKNRSSSDSCRAVEDLNSELVKSEACFTNSNEIQVELVHPWPEWIELMERLVQQNYFDHMRKDEDGMMKGLGFDLSQEINPSADDKTFHFMRDFKTVQNAVINFGRDRFDILRSLSRQDLQVLIGYGCPTADKKVVFSSKLLRKHVHVDEGEVCSSCSLRSSCEKAYLLTNKEDEARTIDVMRILLAYGFDLIDGSVVNKTLLKMKYVRTVVRKLLHEVVKLSAVPIDPNLPPPVIKKPPPKVKQPPPPPKKRVGRNDVEMKKGDWLCIKCDFLNFAKNTICLQCDAKRPKRQLLPGEWECPQCNFLNYRRNTVCFHCEHKRPSDTYIENQFPEKQGRGPGMKMDKIASRAGVSSEWNFDFDDNESDGADVAAFEYADSQKLDNDFPLTNPTLRENPRGHKDNLLSNSTDSNFSGRNYSDLRPGIGFNDFDEDEDDVDSYELVDQNEEAPKTSRIHLSELEADSEPEDMGTTETNQHSHQRAHTNKKSLHHRKSLSDSEDIGVEFNSDDDLPVHPKWKSSHVVDRKKQNRDKSVLNFTSDNDGYLGFSSGTDEETVTSKKGGQGYNRRESTARGRSKFETDDESDDGDSGSYRNSKQRGKGGRARPLKASRTRGGSNGDFGSSRFPQHNRFFPENSFGGRVKNPRGGNFSFEKRRGTPVSSDNRFDNYLNDERYTRPRMNVR